jgi:hypothetical protein
VAKVPTSWKTSTTKNADAVAYSSSTTAYSSSTVAYTSTTATADEFGRTPQLWTPRAKTATAWNPNPAATASQYLYDSTKLYDSTSTYDGVVSGQDFGNTNKPAVWAAL